MSILFVEIVQKLTLELEKMTIIKPSRLGKTAIEVKSYAEKTHK